MKEGTKNNRVAGGAIMEGAKVVEAVVTGHGGRKIAPNMLGGMLGR